MSKILQRPKIELDVAVVLNESEIRALDALVGYGINPFLKVFYAQMGRAYMEPHEAGLRSLFETIRSDLLPILTRLDAAKKAFALRNPVIRSQEDHDALIARIEAKAPQPSPDQQLCKFYGVETYPTLVEAQARHIEKLQEKLPNKTGTFAVQKVREG